MVVPDGIRPDERILILGIPDPSVVAALARLVARGLLVAIGDRDAVLEARREARALDNVMFVPGTPDELPWSDGFFSRVIDTCGHWPEPDVVQREIARVTGYRPPGSSGV